MPTTELYYMPESPPCRTVEMVANIIGVTFNKHYINLLNKEQLAESYLKLNPMHKVPFIVDGDLKLNESRAIVTYLVDKYKPEGHHLYPKDPVQRARVDELLFYDAGTVYPASSKLIRPILFGGAKELNPDDDKALKEVLSYLNKRLADNGGKKYLLGDELTIADISFATTLSFLQGCGYNYKELENLTAYSERLKVGIPNYHEINDRAVENLSNFINSKLAAS